MKNFIDIIKENSVADGKTNHGPERTAAAHQMFVLCKKLERVVDAMNEAYEDYRFLNEIQPIGFSSVIGGSLDEWVWDINVVADDWEKISKNEPPTDGE